MVTLLLTVWWRIVTLVFMHIFTASAMTREQFASEPLPTNTFNSEQTKIPTHSTLNYNPTFRLNLPGWTTRAEVLPPTDAKFDFTDHVTGYTAPANSYFASQTASRARIDSSEEQQTVTNKRGLNASPATSSVFFRLGNSPVTQYRVVHEPPVRQRENGGGRKQMMTIQKARFVGMSRNPPDFNPFLQQSVINLSKNQDKNPKHDSSANNGESIQAQYIGKTINPPDFNPYEARKPIRNVSRYQDKNINPHISINNGQNTQEQYIGKNINPPNINPFVLKPTVPTVSIPRNIPLSNTNSQRPTTIADNSNTDIKGISFLNPHLLNYQKLNVKDLVASKSNIQSTYPALFIQNVKPKLLIQPQNLTQISDISLRKPQNSPQLLQRPLTNTQLPQAQITNHNIQNVPLLHKSSLPFAFQHANVQNIPAQKNIVSFRNTKPIVENSPVYIKKLIPSTITRTNFQGIPAQESILPSTYTQPNIDSSLIQKNVVPPAIIHTNIGRITTQRSIIPPTRAQSSVENSSEHQNLKDLQNNSDMLDLDGVQQREEDLLSDKSEETSIPGTNFQFDPPSIDDDSYFYSYDINSTKRPKQFHGRNFGQAEKRENGRTTGRYYVQLPDGRIQVVTYYADHTGYHPTVSYFSKKNIDR